jgi:integrase
LSDLFNEGLQYRTIAGYRSMLSAVLPHYENVTIGQHPHIIRLLKGVFNSRPPKVKLIPEWDLDMVLKMLQKTPFEPLFFADLKEITFKTVFLIAITTFRRCSDLQALRLGENSMRIQKKGITFIRFGLSKQDRQKIFVPAFPENKFLDPKRCLKCYLKKTKFFRKTGENQLFLSLNDPHKPVSTHTISKWIVKTIKLAQTDKAVKVKAHSTRYVGPSWAIFNGASLKSVLESTDWSTESTFSRFYFKDFNTKVLQK